MLSELKNYISDRLAAAFGRVSVFAWLTLFPALSMADSVLPSVRFITPSIVRIQWHPDGRIADNGTGICVYDTSCVVRHDVRDSGNTTVHTTDELTVSVDRTTSAIRFSDTRTGKVLLEENPYSPRTHARVATESLVYDDSSARIAGTPPEPPTASG